MLKGVLQVRILGGGGGCEKYRVLGSKYPLPRLQSNPQHAKARSNLHAKFFSHIFLFPPKEKGKKEKKEKKEKRRKWDRKRGQRE